MTTLLDSIMYTVNVLFTKCTEGEREFEFSRFELESDLPMADYRDYFAYYIRIYARELCAAWDGCDIDDLAYTPAQALEHLDEVASMNANSDVWNWLADFDANGRR